MSTIVCNTDELKSTCSANVLSQPCRLKPSLPSAPQTWIPILGWVEFEWRHFLGCCIVVALMAFLDAYFVFRYQQVIVYTEENPICLYFIEMDVDGLSYFFVAKAIGTIGVLVCMFAVYRWRQWMGAVVVQAITLFQIGLITYQLVA